MLPLLLLPPLTRPPVPPSRSLARHSQDNGKPLAIARIADIPLTADHFRY